MFEKESSISATVTDPPDCVSALYCRELAIQLQQDVLKPLDEGGIKLFLVTIGPAPRGFEFAELTGFPADRLLADPDSITYEALGLYKSVSATFLQQAVTLRLHAPRPPCL